jgi:hypothetical protein
LASNQRVGSSNLSGRTIFNNLQTGLQDEGKTGAN